MWTLKFECPIIFTRHERLCFLLPPNHLKLEEPYFSSEAVQNQEVGWMEPVDHNVSASALSHGARQATSRRVSEAKSKVLSWEGWADTQMQKLLCYLYVSAPLFEKLLTKSRNSNSFKPLQQPLQRGENIPILEMGTPRHRTKSVSEELRNPH